VTTLIYADKVSALANNGWRVKIINISPSCIYYTGFESSETAHIVCQAGNRQIWKSYMKEMYLYNLATY
jgi:hypothetical protein